MEGLESTVRYPFITERKTLDSPVSFFLTPWGRELVVVPESHTLLVDPGTLGRVRGRTTWEDLTRVVSGVPRLVGGSTRVGGCPVLSPM